MLATVNHWATARRLCWQLRLEAALPLSFWSLTLMRTLHGCQILVGCVDGWLIGYEEGGYDGAAADDDGDDDGDGDCDVIVIVIVMSLWLWRFCYCDDDGAGAWLLVLLVAEVVAVVAFAMLMSTNHDSCYDMIYYLMFTMIGIHCILRMIMLN